MKYIDAEKLKRFVGELKERAKRNRCDSWGIVPDALEEVEGFIASLQQEQSECSSSLVDIDAVRENFITEVYRVLDADPTNDRANAIINAFDSFPTVFQEQPEVDLDKQTIIDYVHNHYHYDKDFDGYGHSNLRPVFTREDLTELARHFYELGLNARKDR